MWFSPQAMDETFMFEAGLMTLVGVWKRCWPFGRVTAPLLFWKKSSTRVFVVGEMKETHPDSTPDKQFPGRADGS
jgi:hypothetical protein